MVREGGHPRSSLRLLLLGSGVTVAQAALDRLVGVQILGPQPEALWCSWQHTGFVIRSRRIISDRSLHLPLALSSNGQDTGLSSRVRGVSTLQGYQEMTRRKVSGRTRSAPAKGVAVHPVGGSSPPPSARNNCAADGQDRGLRTFEAGFDSQRRDQKRSRTGPLPTWRGGVKGCGKAVAPPFSPEHWWQSS